MYWAEYLKTLKKKVDHLQNRKQKVEAQNILI